MLFLLLGLITNLLFFSKTWKLVFILILLIFYYGLKTFFYYENQNYYNTFNQEYIEIVSDYVIQNYGDCYTTINLEGLYGEAGIFGEPLCGIKYTFKDLNEVTNYC